MDNNMVEIKAELMLVGVLAHAKKSEFSAKVFEAVNNHASSELLVAGLSEEVIRGYITGILTAIRAIDGEDALELFREFSDGLEEASRKTLQDDFREQVEHYSETGED